MRECPKCGIEFEPNSLGQQFCTRNCGRWKHHTAIEERLSERAPADEREAYLAGLIATDGHIERRHGRSAPTGISIKMAASARPLLEEIAQHFDRRVYARTNGQFVLTFVDKPIAWKTTVPELQDPLASHYVRGLLDGDGCISGSRVGERFYPYVSFSYNPTREAWLAPFYCGFLERHQIRFSDREDCDTLRQIRCWSESARGLIGVTYTREGWAHPEKLARARAILDGRAGTWKVRPYGQLGAKRFGSGAD
jgi:hypothetical protein